MGDIYKFRKLFDEMGIKYEVLGQDSPLTMLTMRPSDVIIYYYFSDGRFSHIETEID